MRMIAFTILCLSLQSAFATAPAPAPTTAAQQQSNFGSQVQQNTAQALQTFQNVNYKTLSGNQDQNYFFGDEDNPDISELAKQFKIAPAN